MEPRVIEAGDVAAEGGDILDVVRARLPAALGGGQSVDQIVQEFSATPTLPGLVKVLNKLMEPYDLKVADDPIAKMSLSMVKAGGKVPASVVEGWNQLVFMANTPAFTRDQVIGAIGILFDRVAKETGLRQDLYTAVANGGAQLAAPR